MRKCCHSLLPVINANAQIHFLFLWLIFLMKLLCRVSFCLLGNYSASFNFCITCSLSMVVNNNSNSKSLLLLKHFGLYFTSVTCAIIGNGKQSIIYIEEGIHVDVHWVSQFNMLWQEHGHIAVGIMNALFVTWKFLVLVT